MLKEGSGSSTRLLLRLHLLAPGGCDLGVFTKRLLASQLRRAEALGSDSESDSTASASIPGNTVLNSATAAAGARWKPDSPGVRLGADARSEPRALAAGVLPDAGRRIMQRGVKFAGDEAPASAPRAPPCLRGAMDDGYEYEDASDEERLLEAREAAMKGATSGNGALGLHISARLDHEIIINDASKCSALFHDISWN